jgi:hypothetical protein
MVDHEVSVVSMKCAELVKATSMRTPVWVRSKLVWVQSEPLKALGGSVPDHLLLDAQPLEVVRHDQLVLWHG